MTTTVFFVEEGAPYEGWVTVAAFATKELADEYAELLRTRCSMRSVSYDVTEMDILTDIPEYMR